jgi:hypothetical protein
MHTLLYTYVIVMCIQYTYSFTYTYVKENMIVIIGPSDITRGKNDTEWIIWKYIASEYEDSIMECTVSYWIIGDRVLEK